MTLTAAQEMQARLVKVRDTRPELTEVIDLHLDLMEAQAQVTFQPPTGYDIDVVHARLDQGSPILHPRDIALDWDTFVTLYRQICDISAQHRPDLASQFHALSAQIKSDPAKVRALVTRYLENGRLTPDNHDDEGQAELLNYVLTHTLRPFLQAYTGTLISLVNQERWQQTRCPVCGGEPDIASLNAETGARYLMCARCDAEWLFPRIKCAFCGTTESRHLAYYPFEDEKYRLYVCQNCQRYLKTVDLRKASTPVALPVERITTVELDVAAREQGYR